MVTQQAIEDAARSGADSVYRYLERTAEVVPDGARWPTLSFTNAPQYGADVANGVAGFSLFLSDYARLTGRVATKILKVRDTLDPNTYPSTAIAYVQAILAQGLADRIRTLAVKGAHQLGLHRSLLTYLSTASGVGGRAGGP